MDSERGGGVDNNDTFARKSKVFIIVCYCFKE